MPIYSTLLSVCPRIRKKGGRLVASTSVLFQIFTLGLLHKQVTVEPKEAIVRIRRRWLWLIHKNTKIPFRSITAVTYGYQDLAFFGSWTWAHKALDLYSVGLRLGSGHERHLFHFYGDGEFQNDSSLPDWWFWEEFLFDFAGTQQRESKMFVNALSKMIGAEVAPARD